MAESSQAVAEHDSNPPSSTGAAGGGDRTETVSEVVDSGGVAVSVDSPAGAVRGVKLLGLRSKNGRVYTDDALRSAAPLYEGAKVNVNHPSGDPLAPRDYRDRIGVVRHVRLRAGEGLFADLHFNPKHALAEQLVWDAENAPENVGLSHNVVAQTRRRGSETVVDAIRRVQSVDLVADPATTSGLFEQVAAAGEDGVARAIRRLEECVTRLDRRTLIDSALARHGLLAPRDGAGEAAVTREFLTELIESADDAEVERLVEQRAQERRATRAPHPAATPESRERSASPGRAAPESTGDFVRAITHS